jgi:Nucleoside-diphosphate-sugar epimerases
MDILFIGGTGFFGKAFLNYLKSNPNNIDSVTIVGRSAKNFLENNKEFTKLNNVKYIFGDILTDLSQLKDINYSHVIHAAADSTNVTNLSNLQRYKQIVEGTKNVLEFVKHHLPESKLLFISSGGVYGEMPPNKKSFNESDMWKSDILDSSNVYTVSKRTAEHLCSLYYDEYNLNISIARCFCFSGKHLPLNVHFAIGNFVKDTLLNNNIIIKGDGKSIRSYLDQDDLTEWILEILKKDSFQKTVYNIGSNESISISDLAFLN